MVSHELCHADAWKVHHGTHADYRGSLGLNSERKALYSQSGHSKGELGLSIPPMRSPQKDFDTYFGPDLIELLPTSDS